MKSLNMFFRHLGAAVKMLLVMTVLLGLVYPVAITAFAQVVVPDRANGQLLYHGGKVVGSALLQPGAVDPVDPVDPVDANTSTGPNTPVDIVDASNLASAQNPDVWFHARPSKAGPGVSGGSNLSPRSQTQKDLVTARTKAINAANPAAIEPSQTGAVGQNKQPPVDAVTASASGLDPHISSAYAAWQAPRVAKARGMHVQDVTKLIAEHTQQPWLGFVGNETVNVARLNLALAQLPAPKSPNQAP